MGGEKVRAHSAGEKKGLLQAPLTDFFVVAGAQNLRHCFSFIDGRLGVLGVFQKSVLKGFLLCALIAKASRQKAGDRINDDLGCELTAGQDVVSYRDLFVGIRIDTGIYSLVMTADQDQVFCIGKIMSFFLGVRDAGRAENDCAGTSRKPGTGTVLAL